jgi:hypothetical protein
MMVLSQVVLVRAISTLASASPVVLVRAISTLASACDSSHGCCDHET